MGELSSDEAGHGDEVVDAAITASACLLKRSIHRLDPAVVFASLEAVEYARKMRGDRPAETLERFESAAAGQLSQRLSRGLAWSGVVAVA